MKKKDDTFSIFESSSDEDDSISLSDINSEDVAMNEKESSLKDNDEVQDNDNDNSSSGSSIDPNDDYLSSEDNDNGDVEESSEHEDFEDNQNDKSSELSFSENSLDDPFNCFIQTIESLKDLYSSPIKEVTKLAKKTNQDLQNEREKRKKQKQKIVTIETQENPWRYKQWLEVFVKRMNHINITFSNGDNFLTKSCYKNDSIKGYGGTGNIVNISMKTINFLLMNYKTIKDILSGKSTHQRKEDENIDNSSSTSSSSSSSFRSKNIPIPRSMLSEEDLKKTILIFYQVNQENMEDYFCQYEIDTLKKYIFQSPVKTEITSPCDFINVYIEFLENNTKQKMDKRRKKHVVKVLNKILNDVCNVIRNPKDFLRFCDSIVNTYVQSIFIKNINPNIVFDIKKRDSKKKSSKREEELNYDDDDDDDEDEEEEEEEENQQKHIHKKRKLLRNNTQYKSLDLFNVAHLVRNKQFRKSEFYLKIFYIYMTNQVNLSTRYWTMVQDTWRKPLDMIHSNSCGPLPTHIYQKDFTSFIKTSQLITMHNRPIFIKKNDYILESLSDEDDNDESKLLYKWKNIPSNNDSSSKDGEISENQNNESMEIDIVQLGTFSKTKYYNIEDTDSIVIHQNQIPERCCGLKRKKNKNPIKNLSELTFINIPPHVSIPNPYLYFSEIICSGHADFDPVMHKPISVEKCMCLYHLFVHGNYHREKCKKTRIELLSYIPDEMKKINPNATSKKKFLGIKTYIEGHTKLTEAGLLYQSSRLKEK